MTAPVPPQAPLVRAIHARPPGSAPAGDQRRRLVGPPPPPAARRRSSRRDPGRGRGRRRAVWALLVGLVVLFGGALAIAQPAPGGDPCTQPGPRPIPCAPDPTDVPPAPSAPCGVFPHVCPTSPSAPASSAPPSLPVPIPTGPPTATPCLPGPLQPPCQPPTGGAPAPCTGEGCIPQPPGSGPPSGPGTGPPGTSGQDEDNCGITDMGACITEAINAFFRGIVTAALNPLLDLLSHTLLTTPSPDSLPRIGELWNSSWDILLACYGLLILIGGILVMGYQTLQTRHSVKEIAPRLVVGFLAGALSLWVATKAIQVANGLAQAIMGGGVDAQSAGETLRNLVLGSLNGGIFIIFIGIFLAGMLIALLVTYVVRVAITVVLLGGAPLWLMGHALPQTEGIARWWWKAFGGCLAIQVGQSLTLITAMKVFLAPGGFTLFGPTVSGLVNLLVALALMYILFKIPFWILGSLRGGGGRSLLGSIARGFIAYRLFGLVGGRGGGGRRPRPSGGGRSGSGGPNTTPGATPATTSSGQYMLPLTGLTRGRLPKPPHQRYPAQRPQRPFGSRRVPSGVQLSLPLGDDWPENKPVLGRDGQYRLPLDVQRVPPTPPAPSSSQPGPSGGRRHGQQLQFAFDPYRGNRPTHSGQYPLPLGVTRTPRPTGPPPPAPPLRSRPRGTQLVLPFDPYHGNRPTRSGQYPLPLDGVRRVPPAPPPPPPAPPSPPAPPRPAARGGRQLRLPLDLPKPPRRTPPPKPTTGETP